MYQRYLECLCIRNLLPKLLNCKPNTGTHFYCVTPYNFTLFLKVLILYRQEVNYFPKYFVPIFTFSLPLQFLDTVIPLYLKICNPKQPYLSRISKQLQRSLNKQQPKQPLIKGFRWAILSLFPKILIPNWKKVS